MDTTPMMRVRDLVLVGGGHSHVMVLMHFAMKPMQGTKLTLVTSTVHTPYSGMLPGFVAGTYTHGECHIDLSRLCRFANARLIHAPCMGIDRHAKTVALKNRPSVNYDVLSIDVGSIPAASSVPGAQTHATPVKPIDGFCSRWDAALSRSSSTTRLAVVGGGAGGVELALAMRTRLPEAHVAVFTRSEVLAEKAPAARRIFRKEIQDKNIELHEHCAVSELKQGVLVTKEGTTHNFDECFWCTQAGCQPWLAESGLACDKSGFVYVHETLQTETDADIFAAGDCANVRKHPRPKAGVFAVRQGMPLAENLRRILKGERAKPFKPQSTFLSLISTGDGRAAATKGSMCLAPRAWLWRLKDNIDRKFMHKFGRDIPFKKMHAAMRRKAEQSIPEVARASRSRVEGEDAIAALMKAPMRCGGCGAKVGAGVLSRVLEAVRPLIHTHADVVQGAGDDAAIVRQRSGELGVHTVDFFRAFIDDLHTFGHIAANHALSDCHAMGAKPVSALCVVTVPYGLESKVEDDLVQLLSGACVSLAEAGCQLAGGHTCEGAEVALGFCVYGTLPEMEGAMRKGGCRAGDRIILTKPLGTGALLAADMRGAATGRHVQAALQMMKKSNAGAADVLRTYACTACTDVTGFGLIGHLVEMLKASSGSVVASLVEPAKIPTLVGAKDAVASGIFSSIQPDNQRAARAIKKHSFMKDPKYPLLFDPQTAGGLLATVPQNRVSDCLRDLREAGYDSACVIGEITADGNHDGELVTLGAPIQL